MRELLGAYRSNSNDPFPVFMDEHGSVCFQIHSISTFERVRKYDENSKAQSAEIPYIIEIGNTKRMINIYLFIRILKIDFRDFLEQKLN